MYKYNFHLSFKQGFFKCQIRCWGEGLEPLWFEHVTILRPVKTSFSKKNHLSDGKFSHTPWISGDTFPFCLFYYVIVREKKRNRLEKRWPGIEKSGWKIACHLVTLSVRNSCQKLSWTKYRNTKQPARMWLFKNVHYLSSN